jgi:elongation factor P
MRAGDLLDDRRPFGLLALDEGKRFGGRERPFLPADRRDAPRDVRDGDGLHFMNAETFDQVILPADVIGDQVVYLQENMQVKLAIHEGIPVSIEMPQKVTLEITETEPAMKGQTAAGSFKPAILSNGVRVMVPTHITVGTRVVVMTADGSYVERAKD